MSNTRKRRRPRTQMDKWLMFVNQAAEPKHRERALRLAPARAARAERAALRMANRKARLGL